MGQSGVFETGDDASPTGFIRTEPALVLTPITVAVRMKPYSFGRRSNPICRNFCMSASGPL